MGMYYRIAGELEASFLVTLGLESRITRLTVRIGGESHKVDLWSPRQTRVILVEHKEVFAFFLRLIFTQRDGSQTRNRRHQSDASKARLAHNRPHTRRAESTSGSSTR